MAAKFFFVVCASALFINAISAQYCGCGNANLGAANLIGAGNLVNLGGCGSPALVASANGGGLGVTISSLIAPNGIQLVSENAIEGLLEVAGSLPVIAGVAFEGSLPSSGAAGATYSCGNGNVGIASESLAAAGLGGGYNAGGYNAGAYNAAAYNTGAAIAGAELIGLNAGLAGSRLIAPGSSCNCGNLY